MKNSVGIIQRRLSPPCRERYQSFSGQRWKEEFSIAKSLGFSCIEYIVDCKNFKDTYKNDHGGDGEFVS